MSAITGARLLVRELARQGVDTVFAVPGVQLDWVFHALEVEKSPIRVVVPRHEQATTYMADGYARATGKVGVAMVVPGPGVLNAMAGLATAYASHSRVLLLAGQIHSSAIDRNLGLLHEIRNQAGVLASCTRQTFRAASAGELADTIRRAFAAIDDGVVRPVAVEIPPDHLSISVEEDVGGSVPLAPLPPRAGPHVDASAVEKAAQLLASAANPVVYAGGGALAAGASHALQALAEKLQCPVVMSENGRGVLSDRHPLALSVLGGQQAFKDADVVLVVGSRFVDLLTGAPVWQGAGKTYIGVNLDEAALGAPRDYAVRICADARAALDAVVQALGPHACGGRTGTAVHAIRAWARERIEAMQPLSSYVAALRRGVPDDGILVNELTQVGYLARVAYPVHEPRTLIGPGYQGTLGYAFPTALGAAIGNGKRVVAISGDGGFGWNLQELATAARYQVPVSLVIFNDNRLSNVHALQQAQFGFSRETQVTNPDFQLLARAFGVPCVRVRSAQAMEVELRRAADRPGPCVIEVEVGDFPSPWPLLRLQPPTHPQGDKK